MNRVAIRSSSPAIGGSGDSPGAAPAQTSPAW